MPIYEHIQPGTFQRLYILSFAALGIGVLNAFPGSPVETLLVLGLLILFTIVFLYSSHSLTVTVTRDEITLKFGSGPIRKRFAVSEIESATRVTNRWYNGWGIVRCRNLPWWNVLFPHGWDGWIYNVSGFDAVELQLKNSEKHRIGTDEPDELLAAIESVMDKS